MVAYTFEANYKFIASLRVDPKYEEYQPDFLSFCTHFFRYFSGIHASWSLLDLKICIWHNIMAYIAC